jgi:hypothetical protein
MIGNGEVALASVCKRNNKLILTILKENIRFHRFALFKQNGFLVSLRVQSCRQSGISLITRPHVDTCGDGTYKHNIDLVVLDSRDNTKNKNLQARIYPDIITLTAQHDQYTHDAEEFFIFLCSLFYTWKYSSTKLYIVVCLIL